MTLDEMLGRIYASMPDIGTMADPIKRNPIVQNMARNARDIQDYAAGRSEAYPSAPVEQYMAGVRRPVGPQAGMMDQAMDLVNPLARMGGIGMTVYHGSPHKWNQVDLSKVGTGEGAQAYGHGFYSAGAQGTAELYAKEVKDMPEIMRLNREMSANVKKRDALEEGKYAKGVDSVEVKASIDKLAEEYKTLMNQKLSKVSDPGHLYKLDLPDTTIDKMLDWDAPLKEQSGNVIDAAAALMARKSGIDPAHPNYDSMVETIKSQLNTSNMTGAELYKSQGLAPEEASKVLYGMGIPGVKYYDAGSRAAGDGTRNYVNFSADDILALTRNGVSIP